MLQDKIKEMLRQVHGGGYLKFQLPEPVLARRNRVFSRRVTIVEVSMGAFDDVCYMTKDGRVFYDSEVTFEKKMEEKLLGMLPEAITRSFIKESIETSKGSTFFGINLLDPTNYKIVTEGHPMLSDAMKAALRDGTFLSATEKEALSSAIMRQTGEYLLARYRSLIQDHPGYADAIFSITDRENRSNDCEMNQMDYVLAEIKRLGVATKDKIDEIWTQTETLLSRAANGETIRMDSPARIFTLDIGESGIVCETVKKMYGQLDKALHDLGVYDENNPARRLGYEAIDDERSTAMGNEEACCRVLTSYARDVYEKIMKEDFPVGLVVQVTKRVEELTSQMKDSSGKELTEKAFIPLLRNSEALLRGHINPQEYINQVTPLFEAVKRFPSDVMMSFYYVPLKTVLEACVEDADSIKKQIETTGRYDKAVGTGETAYLVGLCKDDEGMLRKEYCWLIQERLEGKSYFKDDVRCIDIDGDTFKVSDKQLHLLAFGGVYDLEKSDGGKESIAYDAGKGRLVKGKPYEEILKDSLKADEGETQEGQKQEPSQEKDHKTGKKR